MKSGRARTTACQRGITFLGAPCCACCGYPFDFDLGPGGLCGSCLAAAPRFDRARAAMRYDDASRQLILALKHGDRLHLAPPLAQWMRRAAGQGSVRIGAGVRFAGVDPGDAERADRDVADAGDDHPGAVPADAAQPSSP